MRHAKEFVKLIKGSEAGGKLTFTADQAVKDTKLSGSALLRKESRGSHQRSDYPQRDDVSFLKHSLAYHTGGEPRIDYQDVVITKWPPAERVYGR